eukprot:m.30025 g.30025  ORF g.30025 m.30025 type:complete len:477 (+) comp31283_c0_seq5:69-1499(+)
MDGIDADFYSDEQEEVKSARKRNFFDEDNDFVLIKTEAAEIDSTGEVVGLPPEIDSLSFDSGRQRVHFDWRRSAAEARAHLARETTPPERKEQKKQVVKAKSKDVQELERKVENLKKQLDEMARRTRWEALPVEDTVRRMMLGEPYCLEFYKSLEQKMDLLSTAIKYHDGNCILAALLFLKRTLAYRKFFTVLAKTPEAETHYLAYLQQRGESDDLAKIYSRLARPEDEWMLMYEQCKKIDSIQSRHWHLKDCLKTLSRPEFKSVATVYGDSVKDHVELLGRQMEIDKKDEQLARAGTYHLFKRYPRRSILSSQPLVTTLFYCCFYHWEAGEESIKSPVKLKIDFKLSEKQFLLIALAAKTKLKKWDDIEKLLTVKGWFKSSKWTSVIGMDKVVEILHAYSATRDILEKYVKLIDDLNLRFKMASKVGSCSVAVEALISLKDLEKLKKYREKVPSVERKVHDRIERIFSDPSIRWR